ncbi:MAG: RNase P subunit p30 family protein [Candidatus Aenigmatarchaeota archaeon]
MKFYDLHVKSKLSDGENAVEEMARFAKRLGYTGIAICDDYESKEKLEELINKIRELETELEVYPGVLIKADNVSDLKEKITKVREKALIVIVAGGSYEINRAACDDPRVDILAHPELGRIDSGLDEVCMQAAMRNNVAIQINFREILESFRKQRSYVLNHIEKNMSLAEHFRTPVLICSGAQSIWGMRAPRELVSVANVLGLDISKAFLGMTTVPQEMVENNKKTLEGKKITEGVEIVE